MNDEYVEDDRDESGRATGKSSSELTFYVTTQASVDLHAKCRLRCPTGTGSHHGLVLRLAARLVVVRNVQFVCAVVPLRFRDNFQPIVHGHPELNRWIATDTQSQCSVIGVNSVCFELTNSFLAACESRTAGSNCLRGQRAVR